MLSGTWCNLMPPILRTLCCRYGKFGGLEFIGAYVCIVYTWNLNILGVVMDF